MTGEVKRIGVVGAGLMGAEIAFVFALAGYPVRLADKTEAQVRAGKERLASIFERGVPRGFWPEEKRGALGLIETTTSLDDFADCDFVTEAVFESEPVKAEVFKALDRVLPPQAVICTNTSTIPISALASHVSDARKPFFLGTHYFSPVSRMKLVEVIPAFETAPAAVETAMRLTREAGKTPIRIKDVAGFAVNRVLHVMMIEAVRLVEEGVATPEEIDTACRLGLGHPVGPFELMDVTTSSLCLQAQEILFEAYGERFRPRPLLKQRVQAGYVGGRGKKGWRVKG